MLFTHEKIALSRKHSQIRLDDVNLVEKQIHKIVIQYKKIF